MKHSKNFAARWCSGVYTQKRTYFYLALPATALFLTFVVLPFLRGIPYSFFVWDGFSQNMEWAALDNYKKLFTNKEFYSAAAITLKFTGVSLVLCNGIGLALALCVYRETRLNRFLRTVDFIPFAVSIVLASFIWKSIFGTVCYDVLGLPSILADKDWALFGVTLIQVWRDASYCMILYVAALCNIPVQILESASIDGAGGLGRFIHVTLPMIMPAVTTNITLILGWGLINFDYALAATNGGPGTATQSVALLIYRNIFSYYKAGYGQAMAIVLTVATVLATTLIANRLRSREVEF